MIQPIEPSQPALLAVQTPDGSYTLYDPALRTHYHSTAGAASESRHVFLDGCQSADRLAAGREVTILEIGLGTGLNFLLSAQLATMYPAARHSYIGIEPYPPAAEVLQPCWQGHDPAHAQLLYRAPNQPFASGNVTLTWLQGHWPDVSIAPASVHCIYLDAFDPRVAPELWTEASFLACYNALAPGGTLSTYSINGNTKRLLKALGLPFQRPRGFGPKREMLVITKP